jgi:N-acetylglucosamine-6-phosphate deacetylase
VLGGLRPGMLGDVVLLDAELRVARVWSGPRLA